MVPIAMYAAERQDIRSSWSRREAGDANNSGSRVDDEITKYVSILGGWVLRELCVGFRRHCRLSYRLSTFWFFDTISLSYRFFGGLIVSKCYLFQYPSI